MKIQPACQQRGLATTEYLIILALSAVGMIAMTMAFQTRSSSSWRASVEGLSGKSTGPTEVKVPDFDSGGLGDFAKGAEGTNGTSDSTVDRTQSGGSPLATYQSRKQFMEDLASDPDWRSRRTTILDAVLKETNGDYTRAIGVIKGWRESDPALQDNADLVNTGHFVNASAQIQNGVMIEIVQSESLVYNMLKLTGIWQAAQSVENAGSYIGEQIGRALGGTNPGVPYKPIASYPTEASFLSEQEGILDGLFIMQARRRQR